VTREQIGSRGVPVCLLKEVAGGGKVKGDVITLEDFSVLAKLKEQDES
jgi:hypothetical protein